MSEYSGFGKLLRKYRKKWNGISQEQLAERVKRGRNTVSRWERSERVPDRDMILNIGEALRLYTEDTNRLLNAAGYAPIPIQGEPKTKPQSDIQTVTKHVDTNALLKGQRQIFTAKKPPDDFVPRPNELEQLIDHLLAENKEDPVAITTALNGAGGYGKTTLAAAICHDERIQKAYTDGILWVDLGPNPMNLTDQILDLIEVLTAWRPGYTSMNIAEAELENAWGERTCLLVVDDVWNEAHLRPFLRGGPNCARLITTRNSNILPRNTEPVVVDAMQREEAVTLLGADLPDGHEVDLQQLAGRLGEWPLLLKLTNQALYNKIRAGVTPGKALEEINEELTDYGLATFDASNPQERNQAVAACLNVSLSQLQEKARYGQATVNERTAYADLAVFPRGIVIPLGILTYLWGDTSQLKLSAVRRLCERLKRLSLMLEYNVQAKTIRLHDVIRQYLVETQAEKLTSLHNRVCDYYQKTYKDRWLECDEYGLRYLVWHLYKGERFEELFTLIEDQMWSKAKLDLDPSWRAFSGDVDLAIQAATAQGYNGLPRAVGYHLLQAELHDRARPLSPQFIDTMAYLGQDEQALGLAELQPDPLLRVQMLHTIARRLQDSKQEEKAKKVLRLALKSIKQAQWGDEEKTSQPKEWMLETENVNALPGALMQIIVTMGELGDATGLLDVARVVSGLPYKPTRRSTKVELLAAIAHNLTKAGAFQNALGIVDEMDILAGETTVEYKSEERFLSEKRTALILIAEALLATGAKQDAQQICNEVLSVLGGERRALDLVELARIAIRNKDFESARRIIIQIDLTDYKNRSLVWLARGIADSQQENAAVEILKIARSLGSSEARSYALIAATDAASRSENPENLYSLISEANKLVDRFDSAQRSRFLSRIVFHLAERRDWKRAQDVTNQINDLYWKVSALVFIVEAAYKNSLLELALHSLENATDLLPESIIGSGYWPGQSLELRCLVARAWAPIDRERGLTTMAVDALPALLEKQDNKLVHRYLPFDSISLAFADLGLFDEAEQFAKLARYNQAQPLIYLGKRLIEEDIEDGAIRLFLQAATASIRKTVSWLNDPGTGLYSSFDEALWGYEEAVRYIFKLGGQSYFTQCLKLIDDEIPLFSRWDPRHRIPLQATLEHLAKELGWGEQATLAEELVKIHLADLIPDSEAFARKRGEELEDGDEPVWQYSFWEDLFSNWPPSWIVHRFSGLSNKEIAIRLRHIEQHFKQWLSTIDFSTKRRLADDEKADRYRLSVLERNRLVSLLARRFAQFQLYDDALRVIGLLREDTEWNLGPVLDLVSFARLALLSCHLGDPVTCRECLQRVIEYAPKQISLRMGEAYGYAAEAAKCVNDKQLIERLRMNLIAGYGRWHFRMPALATLGETEALRALLSTVDQIEWGDDQADFVVAITNAMAMAQDREGLALVRNLVQSFTPEKPQFWLTQWSTIVSTLMNAYCQLGNYSELSSVVNWLFSFEPREYTGYRGVEVPETDPAPWIIRLCAYACRLLAQNGQDEHEHLVHQTANRLNELSQAVMAEGQDDLFHREKKTQIVPAYLDLAWAYADLQYQEDASQLLNQALQMSRGEKGFVDRFYAPRDVALSDLTKALVNLGEVEQAISILLEIADKGAKFSGVYSIIAHLMDRGDFPCATELVSQYQNEFEWSDWREFWQLYQEVMEVKLLGHTPDDWAVNFLNECARLDDFGGTSQLCTMAANTLITHGDNVGSERLVKHVLDQISLGDSLNRQEVNALTSLVKPITEIKHVELLQRLVSLVINRRWAEGYSVSYLTKNLVNSVLALGAEEVLNIIFASLKDVEAEIRHDIVVLLAQSFEQHNDIENLHRLVGIQIPLVAQSDEFHLEVGVYGTIGRALFNLEGEGGLVNIMAVAEGFGEYWKPLLLTNLAWAIHTVASENPKSQSLLEQAILASDSLINILENDPERRHEAGAPADTRRMWEEIATSIAVIGATATLMEMNGRNDNLFNRAISIAKKIGNLEQEENTLALIAKMMALSGKHAEAKDLALSIGDRSKRNSAIEEVVSVLVQQGDFPLALALESYHTETRQSPIFAIGRSLKKHTDMSALQKVDIITQAFHASSTRGGFGFWQCFRAMLPVMEQVGGGELLTQTWQRIQKMTSYTF